MRRGNVGRRLVDHAERGWRRLQTRRAWPWVAGLAFLWFAATTWMYPLLLPDEGRYVGVAWHMLASQDFLTPRLDGLPFFHKPPLFYWLTSAALSLFGDNAWAGRLVSVLSATILVTVFYLFIRRYGRTRAAGRVALILIAQPFLFGAAHYADMDMLVGMLIGVTVLAGADAAFRYEQLRPARWPLIAMYVAAALGFLAKGLIGLGLPAAVLFFWLLGRRRYATMMFLLWWPGIVLFLVLTLPWLVAMQLQYPGFFHYFIVRQQFQRFLDPGFNDAYPFWFYVPVILALTLPWSVRLWRWFTPHGPLDGGFVPPVHRLEQVDRRVLRGLMFTWFIVIVAFFSIPHSKLVGYVIAALPPLAWFIQETFEQHEDDAHAAVDRTLARHGLIGIGLCLAAVLAVVLFPLHNNRALSRALAEGAQPGDRLVMLDQYAYDVPMAAHWRDPIVVVSAWDDPNLQRVDGWRLELRDAADFAPALGKAVLWLPKRLSAFLCDPAHPTTWLIGKMGKVAAFPELTGQDPVWRSRVNALWRIRAGQRVSGCAEMPRSAPE